MLIQKVFHVHHNLDETKSRLANLHGYRRELEGFRKAVVTSDGVGHFEFTTGNAFSAQVEMTELPCADSNQVLFRSNGGNMEVAGLIEFVPVREQLTEIQLTIEYAIKAPMHSMLDAVTGSVDRFVNRQLRCIQGHFEGVRTFPSSARLPRQKHFAAQALLAH